MCHQQRGHTDIGSFYFFCFFNIFLFNHFGSSLLCFEGNIYLTVAYRLSLPTDCKIHPVFHISLLKDWKTADLQEDQSAPTDDVPDIEEPYCNIEKTLRWRKVKRGRKILKEYLILWKGYPVEEASWVHADQFSHSD